MFRKICHSINEHSLHADAERQCNPPFTTISLPHNQQVLLFTIVTSSSPNSSTGKLLFSPQSRAELKSAINACLNLLARVDCSNGTIGEWDVVRVTDMSVIFMDAILFNSNISKWDVSRVRDMSHMFAYATQFDYDISKWDVSSVTTMSSMLKGATSFNGEISQWNISSVTSMASMFRWMKSFNSNISLIVGRVKCERNDQHVRKYKFSRRHLKMGRVKCS